MKIIYATYIDNQAEIKYPVSFLLQEIPDLFVYCSDEWNQKQFMYDNLDIVKTNSHTSRVIDFKIKSPGDISIAQNKCIDEIFKTENPDFIVWLQADTYITEEGHRLIKEVCIEENLNKSFALNLTHLRLFHICHSDYFGVTIFGKKETARFTGDGAHTPVTGENALTRLGSNTASVDIGYLTITQCRDHLIQHEKTWGYNENCLLNSDENFVKEYLKKNDVIGLIQENDIFYQIVKKMNLVDQYQKMKIMCGEMKFSKHGRLAAI